MRHACSDLALASLEATGDILPAALCFHAQQAAEKALKAVLVRAGIGFPRVHSLERLIDLLPANLARPPELLSAARLTDYATVFRYPGGPEPVTEEDVQAALATARFVVGWAQEQVA